MLKETVWDGEDLYSAPDIITAKDWDANGVEAVFYSALPYKGKQTKVFAYLGFPENASSDSPVPAVVCVPGGGGTAFDEWVRIWNKRGYAAIALDIEGTLPEGKYPNRPTHPYSGPDRKNVFEDIDLPVKDQWMYHAVADVVLANSLMRSFPQVDSDNVGLTGVSWGGVITGIVMGVDERFKYAVPVYGCGFLYESDNYFGQSYKMMGNERAEKCKKYWDPATYLHKSEIPSLWVNGTNDAHFYLDIYNKSYRATSGNRTICIKLNIGHSHQVAWRTEEVYAFADSVVKGLPRLTKVLDCGRDNRDVWCDFESTNKIVLAELLYCKDVNDLGNAEWEKKEANINYVNQKIECVLPKNVEGYFFNLTDSRGLIVSSCFTGKEKL
ncbi:MAG: prolyl oligopeptidase family serine peptidase [Sedimentisphaeraceae bacterium JB056]